MGGGVEVEQVKKNNNRGETRHGRRGIARQEGIRQGIDVNQEFEIDKGRVGVGRVEGGGRG